MLRLWTDVLQQMPFRLSLIRKPLYQKMSLIQFPKFRPYFLSFRRGLFSKMQTPSLPSLTSNPQTAGSLIPLSISTNRPNRKNSPRAGLVLTGNDKQWHFPKRNPFFSEFSLLYSTISMWPIQVLR